MNENPIVRLESANAMAEFIRSNGTQCRFVSLVSETEPKLKKSCPFQGVRKITRTVALVNVDHAAACERGLAKALGVDSVDYEPGETWYAHETDAKGNTLPLCFHPSKPESGFYLQYFPRRTESVYRDASGNEVSHADLTSFFYARKEAQGKPRTRVVSLANLRELRASGVIAQAGDIDAAEKALA